MGEGYQSVRFWPAVGRDYKKSSTKLLILGESHYTWEDMPPAHLTTIEAIKNGKDNHRFWKGIAALFDRESDFWDEVVFYNFVQELVGSGPRQRPANWMWTSKATVNGFKDVLRLHSPDRVLVVGKTNWLMLPENRCFSVLTRTQRELRYPVGEVFQRGLHESEQFAYWYPTTGKNFALCAPIFHPGYPAGFHLPETRQTVRLLTKKSWSPKPRPAASLKRVL